MIRWHICEHSVLYTCINGDFAITCFKKLIRIKVNTMSRNFTSKVYLKWIVTESDIAQFKTQNYTTISQYHANDLPTGKPDLSNNMLSCRHGHLMQEKQ